jgi:hypothetical protein
MLEKTDKIVMRRHDKPAKKEREKETAEKFMEVHSKHVKK